MKKILVLAVMLFSLTSVASVAKPGLPPPTCWPCNGGGN
jgi:hypothetical protein